MPSNPELKEFHCELLYLLSNFHQICKKHNIKYSVHGGTLLGAIREHGFIPWDDDADITLSREEYEKLKFVLRSLFDGKEITFDDYSQRIPRIILKRPGRPVVWLDLFIYDYISEKKVFMQIKKWMTVFFLGFTKTKQDIKETKLGSFKGIRYYLILVCYYFGKLFPYRIKLKMFRWMSINFLTGKKKFVYRSNDQYRGILQIFPKEILSEYSIAEFEGEEVMIFKEYEAILISEYGKDYMTPKMVKGLGHDFFRKRLINQAGRDDV